MDIKNEVKAYIVREGLTMNAVVKQLNKRNGWSRSSSNFSDKLTRETIKYKEIKEIAEILGYEIVWRKK